MATATAAGTLNLQPSFDFNLPDDADTEFGNDNALQSTDVNFIGAQLTIIGEPNHYGDGPSTDQ